MKKIISLILSAAMLAGTFATTAMASEATAEVTTNLQSADYISYELNEALIVSDTSPTKALSQLSVNYTDDNAVSYEYKWMLSNSENGEYITALCEKESTYLIANYDMNKYIKAEVTPVYADGSKGTPVETANVIHVENLGTLSRTTYTADEIAANQNNPSANYVNLGGEQLLILDSYSDTNESFYVMSAHPKGRRVYDADNTTKFDTSDSNNIAAFLNGEFLTTGLVDGANTYTINSSLQSYIPTHTWWTEAGYKDSNSPSDYSVEAKIGLMSRSEYQKYWGKFGWSDQGGMVSGWWLRTGRGVNGKANTVMASIGTGDGGKGNTWDIAANATGFYVRPTFYLKEDAFRNIKADVNTMGEDVKAMLMERYDKKELMGIYSENELGKIGYDMVIEIPEKAYDMYTKDEAAIEVDYVAEDMDDIIISYTNGTVSGEVSEFLYPDDVYKTTISMSDLPYGDNTVTVTMKNSSGTVLAQIVKDMHIIPAQSEKSEGRGIVIHPAQYSANNNVFDIAAKLGFTRVRMDFPWSYIETVEGEYDFTRFDSIVAAAEKAGIDITVLLCYNNNYYTNNTDSEGNPNNKGGIDTTAELAGFIKYVKKVAAQYPEIDTYEIWNEPNHPGFWADAANADDYSTLVKAVSDTLYEINPEYTIYAGAIDVSKAPEAFIGTMFEKGLYDYFDALSYHPYFTDSVEDFESNRVSAYENILLDNGGFKRLVATEVGFNISATDADSETTRAGETVKALVVSDAYNTSENYVYDISNEVYGILTEDYAPRKLMYSMAYYNSVLGDARFLGKLDTAGTTSGYVYLKNNEPVAVLWSTNSDTFTLPDGAAAYDMYGNAVSVQDSSLSLSAHPVYVFGLDSSYAQAAAANEKAIRTAAIQAKYPGLAELTKSAVMESSLTDKEKSAALYMLYELNKADAIYSSVSDTSDLTIPTDEYNAVDCGGNIYAEAALKLAKKYIDESNVLVNSSAADKNNKIAANNAIAKDLIETASLLSESGALIYDVAVNDGVLTFKISGVSSADVWVATYSGGKLNSVQKLSLDSLRCTVGENSGKIFVWNGLTPVTDSKAF